MLPEAEFPLWNGPIPCKLLKFDLAAPILLPPVVIELPPCENLSPPAASEPLSHESAGEVPSQIATPEDKLPEDKLPEISAVVPPDERHAEPKAITPPAMTDWSSPHVFDTNHVPGADELPFLESDLPRG
jgi:hypothetical protein